ncbi:EscU/YscU/HrcU family type III secretion system export apparatus switch protein [Cupriavidus basilensis]|uniref:EscU/YscU/HrcU family type III secretion system export apparatus switch protein n=1 Tax=Cupriavidus basilensis TaxID=68895 RepID=UPI0023E850D6|nr:EscU/YscU/HrcU family type III secretion system export apparatus switch protein [Cupriavidus basilensis]MDF3883758.1 EscU/YscU/HrcU family type III secretion system export apparatus switch protein [Cupriavidus basilensis]
MPAEPGNTNTNTYSSSNSNSNSNSDGNPQRGAAIALSYAADDSAPRVVAKGYGVVAESIIARARESGVYVHDSPALVSLLMQVDLDSHIPPQLYVAVAELLAWLYRVERGEAA